MQNFIKFVLNPLILNKSVVNKSLKRFYTFNKNVIDTRKVFCNKKTFFMGCRYCTFMVSKSVLNNYQKYNKPLVLLSGILTFLGLSKENSEEKESELIIMMKKGILYTQREQYNKAEHVLHSALRLAQDDQDEEAITYIYDLLACAAFESGQFAKAEKLFVSVLQRLLAKGEEENSNKVIHISLKMAKIYESANELKKAEMGYRFCIDSLDKKLQTDDEDTLALWGMSMDWYGRFLLGINKKQESLDCFKKAYDMCVKVNGLENEQTVVLLNDLGTVSSLMGDTDSALSYFEKAKSIGDKLPNMKDIASIYINLGQLYLMREMYEESKTACEEGLRKAKIFEDEEATSEANHCLDSLKEVLQRRTSKPVANVK